MVIVVSGLLLALLASLVWSAFRLTRWVGDLSPDPNIHGARTDLNDVYGGAG